MLLAVLLAKPNSYGKAVTLHANLHPDGFMTKPYPGFFDSISPDEKRSAYILAWLMISGVSVVSKSDCP